MKKTIEKATIVQNKYCSACSAGALCLADGPIPDFEVAAVAGLFGIANWEIIFWYFKSLAIILVEEVKIYVI